WDASALAKRYAPEPGTPLVNHLFARVPLDRMTLLNVGMAEVVSVLVRKRNAGGISHPAFSQALVDIGVEIMRSPVVGKVVADDAVVTAALPLLEKHALNATDSLVLRSALDLAAHLRSGGDDVVLVSSDQRLLRAAQAEGLLTFDPET